MKRLNKKNAALAIVLVLVIWGISWWTIKQRPPAPPTANHLHVEEFSTEGIGSIKIETWETKRGISVYFVPVPTISLVDIRVGVDAGYTQDGQHGGVSTMVTGLLDEGTTSRTAEDIANTFDTLGVQYQAASYRDFVLLKLRSLTDKEILEPAVDLLADIIANPSFEEKAIQRVRQQCLLEIEKEAQLPGKMAARAFTLAIYGNHPYANARCGTSTSLAILDKAALQVFHQRHFVSNNITLTIVGGIGRIEAEHLAERFAEQLQSGEASERLPPVQPLSESSKHITPLNIQQAHILFGQPCLSVDDSARIALTVGNSILGAGSLTTRLFNEVREKRGLVYQIYSAIQGNRQLGPFWVGLQTEVSKTDEAIATMQQVVSGFIKMGPTEKELASAKQNTIGEFSLRFASNADMADLVSELQVYQLPLDYLSTYVDKVMKITVEDVRTAFQQHLNPNKMALIVVGQKVPDQTRAQE